eukprot:6988479-Prymnesium_polylepis.1
MEDLSGHVDRLLLAETTLQPSSRPSHPTVPAPAQDIYSTGCPTSSVSVQVQAGCNGPQRSERESTLPHRLVASAIQPMAVPQRKNIAEVPQPCTGSLSQTRKRRAASNQLQATSTEDCLSSRLPQLKSIAAEVGLR